MFKRTAFILYRIFCNIINIFTVTFDQFNVSLLYKSIIIFKCLYMHEIILFSSFCELLQNDQTCKIKLLLN